MIDGITSSNLDTYIEYLKNENQTAQSADLSFSLEEYLEAADAESCIQISESTLKDSDKDFLKKNADKLASFGVSQEQIKVLVGESENGAKDKKSDKPISATESSASSLSSVIGKVNSMKAKDKKIKANVNKLVAKNTQQQALANANYVKVEKENAALKDFYESLKANVSAQEDAKEQAANQAAIAYQAQMVGKMDSADVNKTEKYQEIEKNTSDVQQTNIFSKGFKADSETHFTSVSGNLNFASTHLENSAAYTLAGDIMHSTGLEIMNSAETNVDLGVAGAQEAEQMMSSGNAATQIAGQSLFDSSMAVIDDSVASMGIGQDASLKGQKYYNSSVKYIDKGNMFVTNTSSSVSNIVSNNNSLTAKIQELQSKEV